MRMVLSGYFIKHGKVGGAEYMFYNLARGLEKKFDEVVITVSDLSDLDPDFVSYVNSESTNIVFKTYNRRFNRFLMEYFSIFDKELRGAVVLYPNYFVPPLAKFSFKKIFVVIHDFQYLEYPQYFSLSKNIWLRASQVFSGFYADRVITISDFSKGQAARIFTKNILKKISVIYNPVSWERFGGGQGNNRFFPKRYVLTVAAQYPHKNLKSLLDAFVEIKKKETDLKLVLCGQLSNKVVGSGRNYFDVTSYVKEKGLEDDVVVTGFLNDSDLGELYRNASLFVLPSVYEGFGMPAVEALGLGIPTVISESASLPEVTDRRCRIVKNPYDISSWVVAILSELKNDRKVEREVSDFIRKRYEVSNIGEQYYSLVKKCYDQ